MAKKVWISFPLTTSSEANDASVVSFLKGGQKKELEVEIAAFITKWLIDKSVPFAIDFASSTVDRNVVVEALPKRLQKLLVVAAPVAPENVAVPEGEKAAVIEESGVTEPIPHVEEVGAVEQVAEVEEIVAEASGDEPRADDPSELR